MPRNVAGVYTAPASTVNPAVPNTVISSVDFNAQTTDLALALTQSIASTGVTTTTAAIPFAAGLTFAGGTLAAPGLSLIGSPATGLYSPGVNQLGISINGVAGLLFAGGVVTTVFTGALVGDATATLNVSGVSPGSTTITLATVNPNIGVFGSSTQVPVIAVNGKGQITGVTLATVSGGGGGGAADADLDAMYFGDGSDGNVTISGSVTLTRDMNYANLTISAGAALNTNGWRIFVSQVLDLTAAPAGGIQCNGNVGSPGVVNVQGAGAVGINAGVDTTLYAVVLAGGAGGAGAATNGSNGQVSDDQHVWTNSPPAQAASGKGGNGTSGTGAAAQTSVPNARNMPQRLLGTVFSYGITTAFSKMAVYNFPGAGGGGGAGDGTAGGGGGGGGGVGATIAIFARTISRGIGTAVGAIQAKGNVGGAGGVPAAGNRGGGGGGAGGGGGWLYIVCRFLFGVTGTNILDVTGGNGGLGGNGTGTGTGADGGGAGPGGLTTLANLQTGAVSWTAGSAAVAGNAHAGTTGGTGATALASQVSL